MTTSTIFIIALGMSMDACAVSISDGLGNRRLSKSKMILIPLTFAIFQGVMPIIGWFLSKSLSSYIEKFSGVIAFLILLFIGGKMIIEGVRKSKNPLKPPRKNLSIGNILIQAIATSLDALVLGLSLALFDVSIIMSALIIALITFLCCLIGIILGKYLSRRLILEEKAEIFGGIILVLIGIKLLF